MLAKVNLKTSFFPSFLMHFTDEPAFMRGKTFEELMGEIDRIKSQLPCKNVSIPETTAELSE